MASESASNHFSKFLALMYKELLFRKRHDYATLSEILIPILLVCFSILFQTWQALPVQSHAEETTFQNSTTPALFNPFSNGFETSNRTILFPFAPSNKNTQLLMDESICVWKNHHEGFNIVSKAFKNGDELVNYCMIKQREEESIVVATVFNNIVLNTSLPSSLDYTIRHTSSYMTGFKTSLKYRFSDSYKVYSTSTVFLSWQAAVEKSFIQRKMIEQNNNFEYELWMQEFPFPESKQVLRKFRLAIPITAAILYGLIVFIGNILQRVIEEKSNGCKELLKMMGMTDFIYWSSTFVNYFIIGGIIFLFITIVFKCTLTNETALLEHSSFMMLFTLFLLFTASLILFCLALTTFFNKPMYGLIVFALLYTVSFALLYSLIFTALKTEMSYFPLSPFLKFCICLIPPGAILTIFEMILAYEASGEGVGWSNLYSFDAVPDFNLSWVMLAMLFSCLLYAVIIWYIDAVWPGQYGIPKPFYFPLTKIYWCGYKEEEPGDEDLLNVNEEMKSTEFFEDEPIGFSPGIIVRNLSKIFRNGLQTKFAVNNLSLNVYRSQITALLGHNGAGKTTTVHMLTGLYLPSCGTASINGWDVFSQSIKARQSLGVCPQRNVLYDTLTVEEHLKIYATLKGVKYNQLNQETEDIMRLLNLLDKKSDVVKHLSGGMKRKLCLGIAIIGGSKVLFLDEPTSGMDVEARRNVWDALRGIRQNRTIVLTTQYMEEADILGDRIAIMADGELQCCGSPLFLKKKFGTGYHLRMVKNENFDMDSVKDIVTQFVSSATLENDYEREAVFNLISNDQSTYGPLFEELELKKDNLGINSCGVTVTTMEDVFLNIATLRTLKTAMQVKYAPENEDELEMTDVYIESNTFGSSTSVQNQFYGLFMKRLHYAKRHWSVLLLQLLSPFVILSSCLFFIQNSSKHGFTSEPSLLLDIQKIYGKTDSFYESTSDVLSRSISDKYIDILYEKNSNIRAVDPEAFISNYAHESLANYYKRLIVGGSFKTSNGKLNLTAWFNGFPYHAEPLSLLLMDNAILKSIDKSGSITLTNDPLPHADTFYFEDPHYVKQRVLAHTFVTVALSFLAESFVLVPIHERISKAKLLQLMTGISSTMYWLSMFAWDFLVNTIVSLLLIIPFAIFSPYAFFSPHSEAIGTAILLMIFFGWASIPFSYIFSLFIKMPDKGLAVINNISVIIGVVVCTLFMAILRVAPGVKEHIATKIVSWLLKLFPCYALSSGFSNLFAIAYSNAYCEAINPRDLEYNCVEDDLFNPILKCCKDICGDNCLVKIYPLTMKDDACGRDILFLFLDGIFYFLLLLLLESSAAKMLLHHISCYVIMFLKVPDSRLDGDRPTKDSDVLQEEQRVADNCDQESQSNLLIVLNLTKKYEPFTAVNCLTFGVHEKECFGLLGVNGAGKTTTFRMLTGDCYPTAGNVSFNHYSIRSGLKQFQSNIGYCPQFDGLIDRLSAREMITLFARLRGLKGSSMTRYVNALIKMSDLTEHADKPSMVYSGGTKRILSVALALIGAPPLLLLDEPTAGVDPESRRKIWKILSLARIHSGATVILTTHSMDECEAVCSRLAIMVNGKFRCLGSIQHLKSKFAKGYTLIIKLKREELDIPQTLNSVKRHIRANLPGARLKEYHQGKLQYHINSAVTLSHLFKFMNEMKTEYDLENYLISDTSLEQIFLTFARSQISVAPVPS